MLDEAMPGALGLLFESLRRKRQVITLRTTLTKERKRVRLRILSKAAHELAFLAGLVAHTDLMVKIQSTSIMIVMMFKRINYTQKTSSQHLLAHAKLKL